MARKEHPQTRGMQKRSAKKVAVPVNLDMTPLSWAHKKRKLSGKFKVLTRELLNDVPAAFKTTAAARLSYFRQCAAAIRNLPENVANRGFTTLVLPWNILYFPPEELGREDRYDTGHIGGIIAKYDDGSANPIRVNILPIYNDAGKQIDAMFYVTNGWHSRCIALERAYADQPELLLDCANPKPLQVTVSISESRADIARSFDNQNKTGVRPMSSRDSWRNRYHSGDPAAAYAVAVAADYGLDATAPKNKRGKNIFPNGAIVDRLINGSEYQLPLCNEETVRIAMTFLSSSKCVGVYNNKTSLDQNFFGGMCHFVSTLVRPGYAHSVGVKHILARPDFHRRIKELAKGVSETKIAHTLNFRSRKERAAANMSRNENMRYLTVAAAIAELYRESVPEPHTKGSPWEDCPSALRRLLWEAPEIEDADERRRFIVEQQRALPKMKTTAVKSLTR